MTDLKSIPIESFEIDHVNVPVSEVESFQGADLPPGGSRYSRRLTARLPLESMLVRRESENLVVTFHGALDRTRFSLPRFERISSLLETDCHILAFADPWLRINDSLQLAWYVGDSRTDLPKVLASEIATVATTLGARRVVLTGSSGGGFAALQTSALLPGSTAVVFNPQTQIFTYTPPDGATWPQTEFLEAVFPEVLQTFGECIDGKFDWTAGFGDRMSAVRRYSVGRQNRVVYATNIGDHHHETQFQPFRAQMSKSQRSGAFSIIEYDGGDLHAPPDKDFFLECIRGELGSNVL